jgi:hypothetical protein
MNEPKQNKPLVGGVFAANANDINQSKLSK